MSFVMYNYDQLIWTTATTTSGDAKGLGGIIAMVICHS
jgi:hypothetical protein